MIVFEFEQGTPEWKAARAGKVTASKINDVMAKIKSGEAASRRDYKFQIVTEILTGAPVEDGYMNEFMAWGSAQEEFARARFEVETGIIVDQVGLVRHPTIERSGGSPDGLIGDNGLIEIKCPKTATHISYIMGGVAPANYHNQMLWLMEVCERDFCEFISYDPRLPEELQMFVAPFKRDEERIKAIRDEVGQFLFEVDEIVGNLRGKGK